MTGARFAVLDLGSTTFQLLVADADSSGSLVPVFRDRVVLHLARVLAAGRGRIAPEDAARAADTARRLTDLAVRMGADHLVPLATSALRDSPNRRELARLLDDAVGTQVRFIDGREEARLTCAGVAASVGLGDGATLLLDLGGGSLEVALADPGGLRWGRSLPVGAGRLTEQLVDADPPGRAHRKAVKAAVEDAVAPLVDDVTIARPVRCVASGGTAGALARLIAARSWSQLPASLNQYEVRVSELREVTRELSALPLEERLRVPGMDERRAGLLPAGGWILTAAASAFGAKRLVHSEWGLREGAVLDALGLSAGPVPDPADLRRRSVDRLVRAWGEDPAHAELVSRLAVDLFDASAPIHGLGEPEREWLAHAGRLHEIGTRISPARLHKHGAYLIEHGGLRGYSPHEVAAIASLVRFHRGKDPRPVYPPFAALEPSVQRVCVTLTGLLRIAHAIGRGPEDDGLVVTTELRTGGLDIAIAGSGNPEAAAAEARQASGLLRRTLRVEVEVAVAARTSAPA